MKSIKERAKEYVKRVYDSDYTDVELGFIRGAQSEHEELTRWNSPEILPDANQWIIVKVVNENNGVLYYDTTKFYSKYFNELEESRHTLLGWREIHE